MNMITATSSTDFLAELTKRREESGGMDIPTLDEWNELIRLAQLEQDAEQEEKHGISMPDYLMVLTANVRKIHRAALFDGKLEDIDRYPFAAQFMLTALGQLESAAASLKLAALSIKASEGEPK